MQKDDLKLRAVLSAVLSKCHIEFLKKSNDAVKVFLDELSEYGYCVKEKENNDG